MEKEKTTIRLTIVTLLMYGVVSWMGDGPFAFFPVNEIVFLIITAYFTFLNYKKASTGYIVMLAFGIFSLAGSQFFLSFILNNEQIFHFFDFKFHFLFRLFAAGLLIFEIIRFFLVTRWSATAYILPLIFAFIVAGSWLELLTFYCLGLVLFGIVLVLFYRKDGNTTPEYPKSLAYLWWLLIFLNLTKLLTIYLYDIRL